MSFLGNLFGGKPQQVSMMETKSEPPEYAKPYLEQAMPWTEELYRSPREYYPDQGYVDYSPTTVEALNRGEARAMAGSPLVPQAQQFTANAMAGGFQNPAAQMMMGTAQGDYLPGMSGANPFLSGAVQPMIDRIQGQMSSSGRLGSGANVSALTSALAPVYANQYNLARGRQIQAQRDLGSLAQQDLASRFRAAGMAPGMAQQDYADIGNLAKFGAAREQKSAEQLADDMARHNFLQSEPYNRLANYMSLVKGGTVGGTTSQPVYGNPASSAIGNILNLAGSAKLFKDAGLGFWS